MTPPAAEDNSARVQDGSDPNGRDPGRGAEEADQPEAAEYLEGLANDMASDGWEFDGLEEMTVVTPPGCLGIGQPQHTPVYVATFKRSKTTHDQVNG